MTGKFYGETAGADIERYKTRTCKCGAPLLDALIRGASKWRTLNAVPAERNGLRYYSRHACER